RDVVGVGSRCGLRVQLRDCALLFITVQPLLDDQGGGLPAPVRSRLAGSLGASQKESKCNGDGMADVWGSLTHFHDRADCYNRLVQGNSFGNAVGIFWVDLEGDKIACESMNEERAAASSSEEINPSVVDF
ncbi:hypothetical protein TSAR_007457, partial [Trichomalopsis sarcophagae]